MVLGARTTRRRPQFRPSRGFRRQMTEAIDALQMRWYRYVINYTLEDQAEAALSLRDATERLWQSLARDWQKSFSMGDTVGGEGKGSWRLVAFVLTLIAIAVWAWRRRSGDSRFPEGAISLVTRSYLTLLRARPGARPGEAGDRDAARVLSPNRAAPRWPCGRSGGGHCAVSRGALLRATGAEHGARSRGRKACGRVGGGGAGARGPGEPGRTRARR